MIVLVLVFVPLFFVLIVGLVTRKWRNPWKLYLVFGKKGSGKSTYLVKLAAKYMKKGFLVYTNMEDMMLPGVRLIDIDKLGEFIPEANSLLLVDEVGMIWDNRNFKNFKPSVRDFFKLQRHYKVLVYLASQTFDIDKKLRDLTDGMILNVNVLNVLTIGKTIVRRITLTESTSEAESRIAENLKFRPFWNWKYTYIPKWSHYFNSFDVPELPKLPYKEIICPYPDLQIKNSSLKATHKKGDRKKDISDFSCLPTWFNRMIAREGEQKTEVSKNADKSSCGLQQNIEQNKKN